jgi:hypothetical protein
MKKPSHRLVESKENFGEEFAVDISQFLVIPLAVPQRLFGVIDVPAVPVPQPHHPPVVQTSTFALHEFEGFGVLLAHLYFNLPNIYSH